MCKCNGMVFFTLLKGINSKSGEVSFNDALQYAFRQENPGND